jgi:CheY-like chemotaxis protein
MNTPLVLLVEDNAANLELVRYLLESHGFACEAAVDGASALRAAQARRPDLVLCDLQLPDVDGFEVLRGLRAMPALQGLRVIAVTAYAMVGDRERILGAGFDGYIAKPLDPARFVGQVSGFLGIPTPQPTSGTNAGPR